LADDNNNRTPEQLAEELNALRDETELRKMLNALTEEQLEQVRELGSLRKEIKGQLVEILHSKQTSIKQLEDELKALNELIYANDKLHVRQVASNLKREVTIELRRKQIRQFEKEIKLGNKQNIDKLKALKKEEANWRLIDKAIPDVLKRAVKAPMLTAQTLGTVALLKFGKSVFDLAKNLHDMEAGFMKATGASQDLARSVTNVYEETRQYGVTAENASAATQALHAGFTDFTFASEGQQKSLIKTGAILDKMGISNQDFAASVQISTKALGMSSTEAEQNMLDLEKFAENLGVAPAEMAKQFAGAGAMMAKMGDQGVGAFKDLQIAAKVSGMEMQKILTLTDKFDTFEGAAEMAGKLNAAMGGNFVNAMDMMMATNPAERFEMIRDSLDQAGLSFDDMSYYQKKFYADSLGLSDVSELALVMSGNTDLVSGSVEESSQNIEEAARRAQTMQSFQEKLNMTFVQMIPVFTPLIDKLSSFAEWLGKNAENLAILTKVVVGFIALFKLFQGIRLIQIALKAWSVASAGVAAANAAAAASTGALATTQAGATATTAGVAAANAAAAASTGALATTQAGATATTAALATTQGVAATSTYTLAGAAAALNVSTGGLMIAVGLALTAFIALMTWLFKKDVSASTFLEGLGKIAHVFKDIAIAVFEALNPISLMTKLINALGSLMSGVLSGITSLFTALAAPEVAENIMKIGAAITDIPLRKNVEFIASMAATTVAATAAGGLAAAMAPIVPGGVGGAGTPTAAPPAGAPPRTVEKVRQPISIELKGDKLAEFVVEVVGEKVYEVNFA